MRFGIVLRVTQMPLANQGRLIAGRLQMLGDGRFAQRQVVLGTRRDQSLRLGRLFGGFRPNGHSQTGRVAAGHQRGARRGANARAGIGVGESHSGGGQAIEMRRLVQVRRNKINRPSPSRRLES